MFGNIRTAISLFVHDTKLQTIGTIINHCVIKTLRDRQEFSPSYELPLFSLVAPAVLISLENNMKMPQTMVSPFGVLNGSMAFATIVYTLFA